MARLERLLCAGWNNLQLSQWLALVQCGRGVWCAQDARQPVHAVERRGVSSPDLRNGAWGAPSVAGQRGLGSGGGHGVGRVEPVFLQVSAGSDPIHDREKPRRGQGHQHPVPCAKM